MSARSSGQTFDLRCEVREKLIDFLQREHPEALPRTRGRSPSRAKRGTSGPLPSRQVGVAFRQVGHPAHEFIRRRRR